MKTRSIVITGCTRGIGRAMTLKMLELGHQVSGCGSSDKTVSALQQETGKIGAFSVVDVCDQESVDAWVRAYLSINDAPDLLINCAGVINDPKHFTDIPKSQFDRVIEVNVSGVANVLRAFLEPMVKREKGVIVNISSGAGLKGFPNITPYCSSKFAVEGLSKSIAKELPEGMACIPLSPGVINTELLQGYWGDERAKGVDRPEQWAEYAVPYILNLGPEHNGESLRIPQ